MKEGCRAEARRGGYNLMKKIFAIILISIIFTSCFLILTAPITQAVVNANPNPEQCQANPNLPGCPANPNPPKDNTQQTASLDNPIGPKDITIALVIGKIIKIFLGIIGTISLIMFIYGGFLMLTSAGRAGQIKTGQQTLVWASIGILVVFTSYAMLKFVFSAFGL